MNPLFEKHRALLEQAVAANRSRAYFSAFSELPSPKVYGENAAEDGKRALQERMNKKFSLDLPDIHGYWGNEQSPYGMALGISYPLVSPQALISAGEKAMVKWQKLGIEGRVGICIEMVQAINRASFEIAQAVMMTTGQGFMMAFQAGAPHAQDRALEAIAASWSAMNQTVPQAHWEKPQGKNPPLVMKKHFTVVGAGVAVVVGCATFPTWNTYPGLFASLSCGNAVIVKPHNNAILPIALTIAICRKVLADNDLDPNLIGLCISDQDAVTQKLLTDPAVKLIDFTGGALFGRWILEHCRQARVYAELAGVNPVIIDSTAQYQAMLKNLAFTLSLYSGQMCTTSQALLIPENGINTDEGRKSFDQVGADLSHAINALLARPEVAQSLLGAINAPAIAERVDRANAGYFGKVILPAQTHPHPEYPQAIMRSPTLIAVEENDPHYAEEHFGPVSFLVKVKDTVQALSTLEKMVKSKGALTMGFYSQNPDLIEKAIATAQNARVALSINLTGGVYVNQSAAFSDFHGTGGNPAANASYTDLAYVAHRFCIVQHRYHA